MYEARECCLLCLETAAFGLAADGVSAFDKYVEVGLRLIKFVV